MMMMWLRLLFTCFLLLAVSYGKQQQVAPTCSIQDEKEVDPALKEMKYDVGDGEQTVMVYVEPPVTSFYQLTEPPAQTKVTPQFNGYQGKFINMSNKIITLWWEDRPGGTRHMMAHHQPFAATGTATFPNHRFLWTAKDDPDNTVLQTSIVSPDPTDNIYVYDPFIVENDPVATEQNLKQQLNKQEREKYDKWQKTLSFNEQYKAFTGRAYLANYLRQPPLHYLWRADYFGQEHWVTTKETHFQELPPSDKLQPITSHGRKHRVLKEPLLPEYRVKDSTMNMTLKVLSCVPRVFEIRNFLSPVEVNHILELAAGINLKLSSTGQIGSGQDQVELKDTRRTRTSYNSWVVREKSPVIDAIYRRAADVLRMDEALLRHRPDGEWPNVASKKPLAEQLQLVHYGLGQEYTAHHDFGFSPIDDEHQGARFATLLLYLNEGMKGGETSFPRWVNAETFKELKVAPEIGKAVLFYSQLPDGNLDDYSQHTAKPVTNGEKWLINLWVHDPVYD